MSMSTHNPLLCEHCRKMKDFELMETVRFQNPTLEALPVPPPDDSKANVRGAIVGLAFVVVAFVVAWIAGYLP